MSRKRGFSLIEVLLAMAILGVGIGVLAQAMINAVNAVGSLEANDSLYHDVEFVARRAMMNHDRQTFEDGGDVPLPNNNTARWEAEIEETETLDLLRVEFKIELPESDTYPEFSDTFTVYLYRKGWMDPIDRETLLNDKKENREAERFTRQWQ
ncbi:MAG: type II secretion system protein [Verrucomicrobiota bacterium]